MRGRLLPRVIAAAAAVCVVVASEWWLYRMTASEALSFSGPVVTLVQLSLQVLLPWLLLAPIVLEVSRRVPPARGRVGRFLVVHGVLLLSLHVATSLPHLLIYHGAAIVSVGSTFQNLASGLVHGLPVNVGFYAAVVGIGQAITYVGQLRQRDIAEAHLSASLAEAQLDALKAKLQPHFLFNALQSINVLVLEQRTDAASEMLERLGHLLRLSLDEGAAQLVPLDQELALLEHYLAIEHIRFADRLRVTTEIAPDAHRALVPNLVLQPLVENAIKHGLARSLAAGRIDIRARRAGPLLELEVQNDGPGLSDDWQQAAERGVGVATTLKRLELLFPGTYRFEMRNAAGGVVTTVTIPCRVDGERNDSRNQGSDRR